MELYAQERQRLKGKNSWKQTKPPEPYSDLINPENLLPLGFSAEGTLFSMYTVNHLASIWEKYSMAQCTYSRQSVQCAFLKHQCTPYLLNLQCTVYVTSSISGA